jgi:F-type H+-transporting ATPase subunit a
MNAVTLVSIALSLTFAQHEAPPAPTEGHGAPAAAHAVEKEPAVGDSCGAHGDLSYSLMHHVTDAYVMEVPGICTACDPASKTITDGFHWNCTVNLRHIFGTTSVGKGTHEVSVSGPLVLIPADKPGEKPPRLDMTPTKHLIMMWLAVAVLLAVIVAASRGRALVPKGIYNFVEVLVSFVRNEIALKNIGAHDGDRFVPYLVTAFFFILFVNLFGLLPFAATATGNLAVTVTLAFFTFVITQYAAIKAMGLGGWLHHLTGGVHWSLWLIMVPVEILGLFTKPFALTVRLFANMIAGHIVILSLIGLIFALGTPWVAFASVPMALAIFMLELFVGFVQAYIFCMLSSLFIGAGLAHHGSVDQHGHGHDDTHHDSHVAGTSPGHG